MVFSGTVIGTRHNFESPEDDWPVQTYYTFKVDGIWKGLEGIDEHAELTITNEWNMCSTAYYIGQPTLDYAYYGLAGNIYNYGVCGRRGLKDAIELGPPVAEFGPIPPPPAGKVLGEWTIYDSATHIPVFYLLFSEEGSWGSCERKKEGCENIEQGWFGIDGNVLTLKITESPDPARVGDSFITEVTFPKEGMVTFTNAVNLTRGFVKEESITVGTPLTSVEGASWGNIKAGKVDQ